MNLLRHEGAEYLVAPRGHTQWVRNLWANLKKWKVEVGVFFGGVGPDSTDEEFRRIARDHPVFRIMRAP